MQFFKPGNYFEVREALIKAGRARPHRRLRRVDSGPTAEGSHRRPADAGKYGVLRNDHYHTRGEPRERERNRANAARCRRQVKQTGYRPGRKSAGEATGEEETRDSVYLLTEQWPIEVPASSLGKVQRGRFGMGRIFEKRKYSIFKTAAATNSKLYSKYSKHAVHGGQERRTRPERQSGAAQLRRTGQEGKRAEPCDRQGDSEGRRHGRRELPTGEVRRVRPRRVTPLSSTV